MVDKWLKKIYVYVCLYVLTYTMVYYSAIHKNKILLYATTWMDIEDIMLIELREKDKYHMISLICGTLE